MMRPLSFASALVVLFSIGCGGGSSDSTNTGGDGGSGDGGSSSTDKFATERQACIDKINALRATEMRPAFARWKDAESCVDQEVTQDEMTMMPHGAFLSGKFSCNGNGQNECLGQGPMGITQCLDQMWAEKDQVSCSGCDACADAFNPSCPNCDFSGTGPMHQVCGHYVNMSAKYFTDAACGFSALGTWDAINFK
jgi:hypothetical protein